MSTKNSTNVEKIYIDLLKHVGLRTYTDLAKFLKVKYPTLMRWKERGKVADIAPFVSMIPTINIRWLTTGEGPMFTDGEHARIEGSLPSFSGSMSAKEATPLGVTAPEVAIAPLKETQPLHPAVKLLNTWANSLDEIDQATLMSDLMDSLEPFREWVKKRKSADLPDTTISQRSSAVNE